MTKKEHLIQLLSQGNVDGILFLRDIPSSLCSSIEQSGAPFVVIDTQKPQPPYACVKGDSELASYTATRHLINCGHRDIAFIGMDRLPDFYVRAFGGYKRALSEANLPIQLDWIQAGAFDEASAQQSMQRILECPQKPTAIFCAGDIFAIGAMNYLQNQSYRVPDDFSVCAIDDIVLARYYHPALTTVRIDKRRMGMLAVKMLDDLINRRPIEPVCAVAFDQLVERQTVRRLAP